MRAAGKIALVFTCIATAAAGYSGWHIYQAKTNNAKRAAAIEHYREQVAKDDPLAEALLARMYSDGDGLPQDCQQALVLYRRSADQDSRAGEAGLGSMYYYGCGVTADYPTAFAWYSKAAAQGNPYAENAVGLMLEHGTGTAKDYMQAASWYRKAAERNYSGGEYNLGRMYWYGRVVPRDRAQAYRWFRKAAADGDDDAEQFLSMPLSTSAKAILLVQFVGGLIFVLGTLPIRTSYWNKASPFNPVARKIEVSTGIFCILSAAYAWYGYTHHLMRRLAAGLNAFTACRWLIDAVMIVALIYVLRLEKKLRDSDQVAPEY